MSGLALPRLKCIRCGHTWIPRSNKLPKVCPRCKSPYWNKQYKGIDNGTI